MPKPPPDRANPAEARATVADKAAKAGAVARAVEEQKMPAQILDQVPDLCNLIIKKVISDLPADISSTTEGIIRMAGDILRLPLRT